jgi:hypothetical protein
MYEIRYQRGRKLTPWGVYRAVGGLTRSGWAWIADFPTESAAQVWTQRRV